MSLLVEKLILCIALLLVSLGVAAYTTLAERKIAAFIQDRLGPNRAGPFGLLQPIADGIKSIFKEEIIPAAADKVLFLLGPCIFMLTACMSYVVIPWGKDIIIGGKAYSLQIADLNIGILYVFSVVSVGVYGVMIGGWASNNKFSLLSAIRASSQMISYELGMGLSIIPIIMMTGSLSLRDIVEAQAGLNWNILYQPVAFLIFFTCALAETNRTPFDLAESESELIGGFHTEYSSMKLAFYLFGEYINIFISCIIIVTLFFGGYNFPFMNDLGLSSNWVAILSFLALFVKALFFVFVFIWIRWTIPRFRYDQLMRLGWQVFIPLAVLNILITGLVITFI